jgi:hypothetical protein
MSEEEASRAVESARTVIRRNQHRVAPKPVLRRAARLILEEVKARIEDPEIELPELPLDAAIDADGVRLKIHSRKSALLSLDLRSETLALESQTVCAVWHQPSACFIAPDGGRAVDFILDEMLKVAIA